MGKQTILSGVRATGRLHIGNYLGAVKQFVELQDNTDNECFFFIADLHALTTPFEPKKLREDTLEVVAEYLAAGIDPEKSVIFLQNHVLEHAELAWIFNCITPLGELERMTQFKDKSKQHKGNINAGLLTYPALMAADILMYKPMSVPVGEDQVQHIELTRVIARKFNNAFGKTFPEPKPLEMKPLRVMSLMDPEKKMSKTGDEALMISDSPEVILKKLKKAVTGSEPKEKTPGVANLLDLLERFGAGDKAKEFNAQIKTGDIKYSDLKTSLAHVVSDYFAEFREKKAKIMEDKNYIADVLSEGAKRARAVAGETLTEVKDKVGLL